MASRSKKIVLDPNSRNQVGAVVIKGDVVEIDLSPRELLGPGVEAMVKQIKTGIRRLRKPVTESTIKRRGPGKPFQVTGRLIEGIEALWSDDWAIVHGGDRLDVEFVKSLLQRRVSSLRRLVKMVRSKQVQDALQKGLRNAIKVKRRAGDFLHRF